MTRVIRRRYGHMAPMAMDPIEGYEPKFYANDRGEPPHVHLYKKGTKIKFLLGPPVKLARDGPVVPAGVCQGVPLKPRNRERSLYVALAPDVREALDALVVDAGVAARRPVTLVEVITKLVRDAAKRASRARAKATRC